MAMLAACVLLLHALQAIAGEGPLPDAIYRFELGPSLERLNLADGLTKFGKPCSFTRQEPDGSISRVVVFSDKLAAYLATLQMPVVTLTFEVPEYPDMPKPANPKRNKLATVHGRKMSDFGEGLCIIRKEDQQGKVRGDSGGWKIGNSIVCY
jgi:hypothetical protein